ncbi:MAG: phage terminase large subunit [Segatella copri]
MKSIVLTKPYEKQKLFLMAKNRHVCYGGARGGGKSHVVRLKAKLMALCQPGIRQLIIRRTYPELIANHVEPLLEDLNGFAKYNKTEKKFTFPNGSSIHFAYCDSDKDVARFQGQQYDLLYFDEATQLSESQMKKINAVVRGVNSFPKRTYYTCNPGGQGHQYIKRIFIDRNYKEGENPDDYYFIQASVRDNKPLMEQNPEYIKTLEALPPKLREAWLDGSWDVYEGQFFEEFVDNPAHYQDRRYTHVIDPFVIPPDWPIYRSFDWGYAKPFSVGWWAVDRKGIAYRITELYGCTETPNEGVKWDPAKVFSKIRETENTHPLLKGKEIYGVADPACWNANTGKSLAEMAAEERVWFNKADNKRIPGWMQVHYRLSFDSDGIPLMYIFKTCKGFIRTIPLLQYSETDPEDLDTTMEDHIADETRYFCMERPIRPVDRIEIHKPEYDPLDLWVDPNNTLTYR